MKPAGLSVSVPGAEAEKPTFTLDELLSVFGSRLYCSSPTRRTTAPAGGGGGGSFSQLPGPNGFNSLPGTPGAAAAAAHPPAAAFAGSAFEAAQLQLQLQHQLAGGAGAGAPHLAASSPHLACGSEGGWQSDGGSPAPTRAGAPFPGGAWATAWGPGALGSCSSFGSCGDLSAWRAGASDAGASGGSALGRSLLSYDSFCGSGSFGGAAAAAFGAASSFGGSSGSLSSCGGGALAKPSDGGASCVSIASTFGGAGASYLSSVGGSSAGGGVASGGGVTSAGDDDDDAVCVVAVAMAAAVEATTRPPRGGRGGKHRQKAKLNQQLVLLAGRPGADAAQGYVDACLAAYKTAHAGDAAALELLTRHLAYLIGGVVRFRLEGRIPWGQLPVPAPHELADKSRTPTYKSWLCRLGVVAADAFAESALPADGAALAALF